MKSFLTLLALALLATGGAGQLMAQSQPPTPTGPGPVKLGERAPLQLEQSAPQGEDEQMRLRIHASDPIPPYDVTKETFDVLAPANYTPKEHWGLFIWISAGNTTALPKDWERILAEHRLIFMAARNSGNPRNIFARMRMAIDANANARLLWNIDGRRVYVAGFSGGARVASMLGVAFGEMFSGTACFMGANFYTDVTGEDRKLYTLNYIPDDQVLGLSKKYCRYALVTSTKDMNRADTRAVIAAFKKEGFANAELFDIPGIGHQVPEALWLGKVLDYLDEGKR